MTATTKRLIRSMVMSAAMVLAASGCGSDGGGGSTTGSLEATMAACNAYCTAYIAKNCTDAVYSSVADCMTNDCGVISAIPAKCQAKMQAYYDCRKAQTDLCADSGCNAQLTAAGTCM